MLFIKDDEFIRGKCPMTKEEIRTVCISKMNISHGAEILDIGSGTGSITIQCAVLAKCGKVTSLERDEEAYNTTKNNIEKFKCDNVELIKCEAENELDRLISEGKKFDSIFIGGSGGHLNSIIEKSSKLLKDSGNIVMNFITLDNAYKAMEKMKSLEYDTDVTNVMISKNKKNTFMMTALNPIFIIDGKKNVK